MISCSTSSNNCLLFVQVIIRFRVQFDWLIELSDNKLSNNKLSDNKLSDNKLSNNKLSDNNLASELVENRSF